MKQRIPLIALTLAAFLIVGSAWQANRATPIEAAGPGASDLSTANQACTGPYGIFAIDVQVPGAPSGLGQQWLLWSNLTGSFVPGTYASNGPLTPSLGSMQLSSLIPGQTYFVGIDTQLADGSVVSSPTLSFMARGDCFQGYGYDNPYDGIGYSVIGASYGYVVNPFVDLFTFPLTGQPFVMTPDLYNYLKARGGSIR